MKRDEAFLGRFNQFQNSVHRHQVSGAVQRDVDRLGTHCYQKVWLVPCPFPLASGFPVVSRIRAFFNHCRWADTWTGLHVCIGSLRLELSPELLLSNASSLLLRVAYLSPLISSAFCQTRDLWLQPTAARTCGWKACMRGWGICIPSHGYKSGPPVPISELVLHTYLD